MKTNLNLNVKDENSAFMFLNYYDRQSKSDSREMFIIQASDAYYYNEILRNYYHIEVNTKVCKYKEDINCILINKSLCKEIITKTRNDKRKFIRNYRYIIKKLYDDSLDMRDENRDDDYIYIDLRNDRSYLLFEDFAQILKEADISDYRYDSTDFVCSKEAAEKLIKFYTEVEEIENHEVDNLNFVADYIRKSIAEDKMEVAMRCETYTYLNTYILIKELQRYKNKDTHMIEK